MLRVARAFRPVFGRTANPYAPAFANAFATKETTGIVGLPVDPDGRETLIAVSEKVLSELKDIPENAAYRTAVEKFTHYRLNIAKGTETIEEIETKIGMGQIEELIEQAQDELKLIPMMKEWQPWDVPEGHTIDLEMLKPTPQA